MAPKRPVKLDRFPFIVPFLSHEWTIVESERGNSETEYIVPGNVLWTSYRRYLERNGYDNTFSNKVLFGKLLSQFGVEKIKRGPRGSQKFFYYPLRPLRGTEGERLILENRRRPKQTCLDTQDEGLRTPSPNWPLLPQVAGLIIKILPAQTPLGDGEKSPGVQPALGDEEEL